MTKCFACFKRARKDVRCLYCRRGPMCLGCVCPCRKKEKAESERAVTEKKAGE
jgi:hypothetical protein